MTNAGPRGPQPARTDRPRPPALRILRAVVASGGATISGLQAGLDCHQNTIRQQLEQLVAQGFVEEVVLPASGRGRPARRYVATTAGRQVALEDPGRDEHGALVEALAEQLAVQPDAAAIARAVGEGWGRRLRGEAGVDVARVLEAQGFTPEPVPDGFALRTCPLLEAARAHPEVVCGIHQGLVDAIEPGRWQIRPFALPHACLAVRSAAGAGPT